MSRGETVTKAFNSEKLQRLQNRAARILMSASYDSNLDHLFQALGWRRLYYQRLEQKSILMYKTLHGMTPDYLRSRFAYCENARAYRLRKTENKLVLPQPRTDYLKRSFLYSGAQLWNNLPVDLRQAPSMTDFKSKQDALKKAYTGLPVVRVPQKQKAMNWVVLNCRVPVNFFKWGVIKTI